MEVKIGLSCNLIYKLKNNVDSIVIVPQAKKGAAIEVNHATFDLLHFLVSPKPINEVFSWGSEKGLSEEVIQKTIQLLLKTNILKYSSDNRDWKFEIKEAKKRVSSKVESFLFVLISGLSIWMLYFLFSHFQYLSVNRYWTRIDILLAILLIIVSGIFHEFFHWIISYAFTGVKPYLRFGFKGASLIPRFMVDLKNSYLLDKKGAILCVIAGPFGDLVALLIFMLLVIKFKEPYFMCALIGQSFVTLYNILPARTTDGGLILEILGVKNSVRRFLAIFTPLVYWGGLFAVLALYSFTIFIETLKIFLLIFLIFFLYHFFYHFVKNFLRHREAKGGIK